EETGYQHDAEHGAEAACLHQQERTDDRRPEERADRGEAAGEADDGRCALWRVALDQPHGENPESAADRDQRRLWAEDGAEAERGERREYHSGQLDRSRRGGFEPIRRWMAACSGERPNSERNEQAAQSERPERPPRRLAVK